MNLNPSIGGALPFQKTQQTRQSPDRAAVAPVAEHESAVSLDQATGINFHSAPATSETKSVSAASANALSGAISEYVIRNAKSAPADELSEAIHKYVGANAKPEPAVAPLTTAVSSLKGLSVGANGTIVALEGEPFNPYFSSQAIQNGPIFGEVTQHEVGHASFDRKPTGSEATNPFFSPQALGSLGSNDVTRHETGHSSIETPSLLGRGFDRNSSPFEQGWNGEWRLRE